MFRKILFGLMVLTLGTSHIKLTEYSKEYMPDMYDFADTGFKRSVTSAVVIFTFDKDQEPLGAGSGNYFRYGKHRFIITASHVVHESTHIIIQERGPNAETARIIHNDVENDLAILVLENRLKYTKPAWFALDHKLEYGEPIYYTGNPGATPFFPVSGMLVGPRDNYLLTNMFAWPGSSGAVVFDSYGHIVGVVSSVMVAVEMGLPQIVPDVCKLSDIRKINKNLLEGKLKDARDSAKRGNVNK
tara:strand:+ start:45 stop:776 length:732 start_codon:yes stop_codon:yes gene_type:complete